MDLKSMTLQEMQEYMESIGEKKFRAKQIYEWFHKHLALSLDEMNNVPKKLKEKNEEKKEENVSEFILCSLQLSFALFFWKKIRKIMTGVSANTMLFSSPTRKNFW